MLKYTHTHTYLHMETHIYTYINTCRFTYMSVCMYVSIHIHIHTYICIYIICFAPWPLDHFCFFSECESVGNPNTYTYA